MTAIAATSSNFYPVTTGSATGGAVQVPVSAATPIGTTGPTSNAVDGVDGLNSSVPTADIGAAGTASATGHAPSSLKVGTQNGSRDTKIDALKERAGFMRGMAALGDALPGGATAQANIAKQAAALTDEARKQKAVDWLTNIAWATGANQGIVDALDKATIQVVPDDELGVDADAAFDEQNEVIRMKASAAQKLDDEINGLARDGIVDAATGVVKDPEALKKSAGYHDIVVTQALIGAHEYTHDMEHATGKSDGGASLLPQVQAAAALSGPEQKVAAEQLVRNYVDTEEYEAYHQQELYQFQMGEAPKSQGWMTIDNQGNAIDRSQAVSNIVQFLETDGFSAQSVASILGDDAAGHNLPGHNLPGHNLPGHNLPGHNLPGHNLPGHNLPGHNLPGHNLPGHNLPGHNLPGHNLPGHNLPGHNLPGHKLD